METRKGKPLGEARFGHIVVPEELYKEFWRHSSGIIPYRIEYRFLGKTFHIDCEHPLFDKIKEGQKIPNYQIYSREVYCDPEKNNGGLMKRIIDKIVKVDY
jgi:hypothetical protein